MDFTKRIIEKILSWVASIPQDKLLHDFAAALVTLYSFVVAVRLLPFWWAFGIASLLAFDALVAKECYDSRHAGHSVELADIAWGVFGIVKVDLALLILKPLI